MLIASPLRRVVGAATAAVDSWEDISIAVKARDDQVNT
jgi:hypothetical protein